MTLAIEGIALIVDCAVETFDREVEKITFFKLLFVFLAGDTLLHKVVGNEMLLLVDSVVQRNIKVIVRDKVCSNQWLPETCDRLRLIIKVKNGGEINWIQFDSLIVYHGNIELAVVLITNGIDISRISLLNVVHLNVGSFEGLFKHPLKSRQAVSLENEVIISIVDDRYAEFWVIGDYDANYIILCIDPRSYSKILE